MKTKPSRSDHSLPSLINHATLFGERIQDEGYSKGSIAKYKSNALALWEALLSAKLSPADLNDEIMDQLAVPIVRGCVGEGQEALPIPTEPVQGLLDRIRVGPCASYAAAGYVAKGSTETRIRNLSPRPTWSVPGHHLSLSGDFTTGF